jgi:hypothetical protein
MFDTLYINSFPIEEFSSTFSPFTSDFPFTKKPFNFKGFSDLSPPRL